MTMHYSVIEILTTEEARTAGRPVHEAVTDTVRKLKIGARSMTVRGIEACYENGERVTRNILSLSFNMPVKVEILVPTTEVDTVVRALEGQVSEGVITSREVRLHSYRIKQQLFPRHLRVKDVMTSAPRSVTPETPAEQVAHALIESTFRGMPVVDDAGVVQGMITQNDLIYRAGMLLRIGLAAHADDDARKAILAPLANKTAQDIMTHPAVAVHPDDLVTAAVEVMLDQKLKRLPVVDDHQRLVGMLSRIDIFLTVSRKSADWQQLSDRRIEIGEVKTVADIMQRDAQTVGPDSAVIDVIRMIDTDRIQRVSVVDDDGRFLGMIADADLLAAFRHHRGIREYLSAVIPFGKKEAYDLRTERALQTTTAADVMKTELMTVREETAIEKAIDIMARMGIKRLPVVDDDGRFKGMISREALLRAGHGAA